MDENQTHRKNFKGIVFAVCVIFAAAAAGLGIGVRMGNRSQPTATEQQPTMAVAEAENYTGDRAPEPEPVEEKSIIEIPGYSSLRFKAGETSQQVTFHNPEVNTCYFKMRLKLADGTVLWESDLLAPGKAFYDITLNQPLETGNYEKTTLEYECYSLNDQSRLNGAACNLVLEVS